MFQILLRIIQHLYLSMFVHIDIDKQLHTGMTVYVWIHTQTEKEHPQQHTWVVSELASLLGPQYSTAPLTKRTLKGTLL